MDEQVLKNIATKSNGLPIRVLEELVISSACDIKNTNQGVSHESIFLKNLALAKKAEYDKKTSEKAVEDSIKKGILSPEVETALKCALATTAVAGSYEFLKSEPGQKVLMYSVDKAKDLFNIVRHLV